MQINPVIRVRVDDSKITAMEVNPYAGFDGRGMDIDYFNRRCGVSLPMDVYQKKYETAQNSLREFVIRKINIENGHQDIPDKYTIEQYGECIQSKKIYNARILEGNNIILL